MMAAAANRAVHIDEAHTIVVLLISRRLYIRLNRLLFDRLRLKQSAWSRQALRPGKSGPLVLLSGLLATLPI